MKSMSVVRSVRRGCLLVACLAIGAGVALAQPAATPPDKIGSGFGYAFGACGSVEGTGTFHLGGGGETLFGDKFGVGAEIGYLMPTQSAATASGCCRSTGPTTSWAGRGQVPCGLAPRLQYWPRASAQD